MKHFLISIIALATLISCGGAEERKEVYLEKARLSLDAGDLDKARVELKNVLQIDPKDAQAYFQLGDIFEKKKEYQNAFNYYTKAVELDSDNLEYHAKIGSFLLILEGDIDAATKKMDLILGIDPANIDGLLLKAGILYKQNDTDGAMKITQNVFSTRPGHIQNAVLLSSLYLKNKNYDEAINVLTASIKKNPNNHLLLNKLAEAYFKTGKYDLTENIYWTMLKNKPEEFRNYLKLAAFYKLINKFGKAEESLRKAIEADEKDTKRKLVLVEFLQQANGNQSAIDELMMLIEKYPEESDYRFALAELYTAENNLKDAGSVLKSVISYFSDNSVIIRARVQLANIYMQMKDVEAAKSIIDDAAKLSPNDSKVSFVKAKIQVINKDFEGAIISLRTVIKDDPENMEAYFLLSAAHNENGEKEQADEAINRAYENNKTNPKGLITLADYYSKNNNNAKLEKIIDHYLSIDADDYRALSYKSSLLNERKMFSGANEYAKKMIKLYPDRENGYIQLVPFMLTENMKSDAVMLLEDGYKKVEKNTRILELLVPFYVADKNFDLAENMIKTAIHEKGETANLYMLLAKTHWLSEKKDAAEASLLKITAIKPDWNEPYINLAELYKANQDNQKAVKILQKGLIQIKGDYKLSLALAKIYEELNDFNAAINVYDKAYEKYSDNVILMNNLAALLSEHRNDVDSLQRAKELANKLKGIDKPVILDTVGWVFYKTGDYPEAVLILKKVIEKIPNVSIFNYHLGVALYKSGDASAAKTYLTRALTNNSNFPGRSDAEAHLKMLQ